jgi:hypothetical protein
MAWYSTVTVDSTAVMLGAGLASMRDSIFVKAGLAALPISDTVKGAVCWMLKLKIPPTLTRVESAPCSPVEEEVLLVERACCQEGANFGRCGGGGGQWAWCQRSPTRLRLNL